MLRQPILSPIVFFTCAVALASCTEASAPQDGASSGGAPPGRGGTGGAAPGSGGVAPGSGGAVAGSGGAAGGVPLGGGTGGVAASGGTAGGAQATGGTAGGAPATGGTAGGAPATGGTAGGTQATGGTAGGAKTLGTGGGTGGNAGTSGMGQLGGSVNAVDCSKAAKAPASFQALDGFVGSEDFVFDKQGNYVGVDENENLVRIAQDKKKKLWVPAVGEVAGMALLPDGSLVFNNVSKGSLQRVQANGSVVTVLGGLLYPNGLELGPDGFVYVAENAAGRVRRVNPDSGEFTVVAMGLQGPNGIAFSANPGLLYVGSFEGSGVYKITVPAPGQLGQASVFARPNGSRLREPALACPAMKEGEACSVLGQFTGGTCKRIANVVDCTKDTTIGPCNGQGCTSSEFGGGIDGLGVDACGSVYASEYSYGNLWRISSDGKIEQLAKLPAMWIPNMRWGRGLGGFKSDTLYVADRDEGRLFAVSVGLPSAASVFGGQP